MILQHEREKVIIIAQRALATGLVPLTFGNFSLRDQEKGMFCITPSGMDYDDLIPEDIVVLDLDGRVVEGNRKPSVETRLHRMIYEKRPDVNGVCHTHSTYATAWASCGVKFPIIVEEVAALVGETLGKSAYQQTGTEELARSVVEALGEKQAALISNHGLVAVGPDLDKAFANAVAVEEGAKIAYLAKNIGEMKELPKSVCRKVHQWAAKNYGQ
ncbi:MAG: class II aldolase/adducin family protein [Clostridia bacterium]|jgi:L-ribulose-5-phosphate 4-epimerase|nr:class II aldolase/adducin family protein [Clostridia bacterium]